VTAADNPDQKREPINRRRLVKTLLVTPMFIALFLFLPAGTWEWPRGWLFVFVLLASGAVSIVYLWRVNPEVVVARSNPHQGTKRWDRILVVFLILALLAIFPAAALDDGRFHWSSLPWWACAVGYSLFLIGIGGMTWAQAVNKFFEPTVRIQSDRGQRVIDDGPYALVRHPGYASCFPLAVGIALSLGSLWALIPSGLSCLVLILRTRWEDQMLQAELAGYKEYAQRVRYRLSPGVW
jgi:protein-S-isoprenylcysteine O-methyltransferase Ste14